MLAIRILCPYDVNQRRKRRLHRRAYIAPGPRFACHIDRYDKLKKFAIHGCIDGYSRKLLWLEVGPTNNRPEVTALFL